MLTRKWQLTSTASWPLNLLLLDRHFLETQHTFSMQLGKTQRVWDYIGGMWSHSMLFHLSIRTITASSDNYVHRLVQNKGDGKLVEVAGEGRSLLSEEKMDSLQLEVWLYNNFNSMAILTSLCLVFIPAEQPIRVPTPIFRRKNGTHWEGPYRSGQLSINIKIMPDTISMVTVAYSRDSMSSSCLYEGAVGRESESIGEREESQWKENKSTANKTGQIDGWTQGGERGKYSSSSSSIMITIEWDIHSSFSLRWINVCPPIRSYGEIV